MSELSPHSYSLFMDQLTKGVQDEVHRCMMFADEVNLIDDYTICKEGKFKGW